MDVTKLVYDDTNGYKTGCSHKEAETCSSLNEALKIKETPVVEDQNNSVKDALEAVKLDPAVLEAQVTLPPAKEKIVKTSKHSNEEIVENEEQDSDDASSVTSSKRSFEHVVSMQTAALHSLNVQQFQNLLTFTDYLRKKRVSVKKYMICAFCKNNGESASWYNSHNLKDCQGRVLCPILKGYRCPHCGATGIRAHTDKYCPKINNQK